MFLAVHPVFLLSSFLSAAIYGRHAENNPPPAVEDILRFGGIGLESPEDFKWDEKTKNTWHWFVDEWLRTVISQRGYRKIMELLMSNENEKLMVEGSADTHVVPSDFALIISMIDCHKENWDEAITKYAAVNWNQKIDSREIKTEAKFDYGGKNREEGIEHFVKIKKHVEKIMGMEGAENLLGSDLRLYYKNKHPEREKEGEKDPKEGEKNREEKDNDVIDDCIDYWSCNVFGV